MPDEWFTASMRLVILVDGADESSQNEVVHLFRANDWDAAFERALHLGRAHETEYLNGEGQRVRWRLDRVLTLDQVRAQDLDGAEVHSKMSDFAPGLAFDTKFQPERHRPSQTGI